MTETDDYLSARALGDIRIKGYNPKKLQGFLMKRPRQHVIESISENTFKSLLPEEWIVRKIPSDYGVDLEVEIVEKEIVTGKRCWIQLKGTESIDIKDQYIAFPADIELLKYSLRCDFPLLLVVVDILAKDAYWIPLREEIEVNLESNNPHWREQSSATVRIPLHNSLLEERKKDYYGLAWYAMEPARMRAFSILHYYYHELQYKVDILNNPCDFDEADVIHSLEYVRSHLNLALDLDCLFGRTGVDVFVEIIKPQIVEGLVACDRLLRDIPKGALRDSGEIAFLELSVTVARIDRAVEVMSTCISTYQLCKSKFLFNTSDT